MRRADHHRANQPSLRGTRPVLMALATVILLQSAFTWLPLLQAVFSSRPLGVVEVMSCIGAGLLLLVAIELDRLAPRAWKRRRVKAVHPIRQ